MIEVKLSDKATVRVDVCRICHFVWFDAHEVDTLVPRPVPLAPPEMPQKAREAVAMLKLQQMAEEAHRPDFYSEPPDEWWQQIAHFCGMRL